MGHIKILSSRVRDRVEPEWLRLRLEPLKLENPEKLVEPNRWEHCDHTW
jgi:hypothetical protein